MFKPCGSFNFNHFLLFRYATIMQGKFPSKNVKMFPDSNAKMFPNKCATTCQNSNVKLCPDNNVNKFPNKAVDRFLNKFVTMFQSNNVNMLLARYVINNPAMGVKIMLKYLRRCRLTFAPSKVSSRFNLNFAIQTKVQFWLLNDSRWGLLLY